MNDNIENIENLENTIPEEEVIFTDTVLLPVLPKYDIVKRDNVFAVLLLLASVITSAFGVWGGFRSGFTLSLILILASVTAYLLPSKATIRLFPLSCMILGAVASLSFSLTTNGAVRFWSFISVGLLYLVWFASLSGEQKENGDLGIFYNIFEPVFCGGLAKLSMALRSLLSGKEKGSGNLPRVLAGIALALPVLLVVIPLLASSDAAFSGMVNSVSGDLLSNFFKLLLGVIIGMFVISYSLYLKKNNPVVREEKTSGLGIENTVLISFLAVISVCYAAYLFSQLAYFFSAFSGFLPEGYKFTVSEYARRGFFEMTVIAVINFALIFLNMLISRKSEGKACLSLRILCTFIGIFTLIIIATALSKMFLYIGSFGMSRLRIQTSVFMIFLGIVFISLIIRLYLPSVRVMRVAFVTAAVVLIALGTANVNTVVAKYNYEAYKVNKLDSIDVTAIYELGDEGIPYLVSLTEDESYEVAESAEQYLYHILQYGDYKLEIISEKKGYSFKFDDECRTKLGEQTLPRAMAEKALKQYVKDNLFEIVTVVGNTT